MLSYTFCTWNVNFIWAKSLVVVLMITDNVSVTTTNTLSDISLLVWQISVIRC